MNQFGDEELKTVLLGSIPKHEDLFCLLGTIRILQEKQTNKAYQNQIFKCRCLIFSEVEVIASPVLGAVRNIHIIVSQKFYYSGKLQHHLDKLNIMVEDPMPVTNDVYEFCLRYTILARLAPMWNQVERYLVHGRDFITSSAPLDAVKLDIVVNENDAHLVLWPLRLRLPQVCAQDLHHSLNLHQSPLVRDLSSDNVTVHVLPSLNLANVVTLTEGYMKDSTFKSYKEIKRYWKNSYGYRLPESEEGMVYLKVRFGVWSECLTYPLICVRARRPVFLRQREPQMVLMRMIADLHARIPNICGFPFSVNTTFRYAIPKLSPLNQILHPCNLTDVKPVVEKYKEVDEESMPVVEKYKEVDEDSLPVVEKYKEVDEESLSDSASHQIFTQAALDDKTIGNASSPMFLPNPATSKPLFVPVFRSKTKPGSCSSPSPSSTFTPVFHPQPTTSFHSLMDQSLPASPSPTRKNVIHQEIAGQKPIKPTFGIAQLTPNPRNAIYDCKPESKSLMSKHFGSFPLFNSSVSEHLLYTPKKETTLLHQTAPESSKKMHKIRNKPQIQDVDIRKLAQVRDGLSKVNTTTLIAFLRREGVPCRVKDKKSDLVCKVLTHLQLPIPGLLFPSPTPPPLPNHDHPVELSAPDLDISL